MPANETVTDDMIAEAQRMERWSYLDHLTAVKAAQDIESAPAAPASTGTEQN